VTLPHSIRKIGYSYFGEELYKTMSEGLFQTADKLDTYFVTLINEVWREQMTPKDWAGLYLFQTANFVAERLKEVSPEHVQTLYEMAAAKKSFQKAADILKPLLSTKQENAVKPDGPFAFLEDDFQETLLLKHYKEQQGDLVQLDKVLLADGSGKKAPVLAVLAAVMPYADLYIKPTHANEYMKTEVQFLSESDKAAALLDHESLMELLWENAKTLNNLS